MIFVNYFQGLADTFIQMSRSSDCLSHNQLIIYMCNVAILQSRIRTILGNSSCFCPPQKNIVKISSKSEICKQDRKFFKISVFTAYIVFLLDCLFFVFLISFLVAAILLYRILKISKKLTVFYKKIS